MKIEGYFGKKGLDKIIRDVNKYNREKEINFYEAAGFIEEDGYSTYQCLYPDNPCYEVEDFSKSEMLYLQKHGFLFKNEYGEIVDVNTLEE